VVYYFVLGTDSIQERNIKIRGTVAKSVALASAIIYRLPNLKASALYYRIFTELFHSGVKHL